MHFGNKVISSIHSTIDMHGKPRTSWTLLKNSIKAGTDAIEMTSDTDWKAGDVIVIPSTSFNIEEAE